MSLSHLLPQIFCVIYVCERLADVLRHQAQELVFDRRQVQQGLAEVGAARRIVDPQPAVDKNRPVLHGVRLLREQTALRGAQSRQKFFYRERFGQIVVRARVQRLDLVFVFAARADHNDRHIRPGADAVTYSKF